MPDAPDLLSSTEVPEELTESVADYLAENPQIAEALQTFHVAQEEYRRSLSALTTVRVVTAHDTGPD